MKKILLIIFLLVVFVGVANAQSTLPFRRGVRRERKKVKETKAENFKV